MTIRKLILLALFSLAAACWLTATWAQDTKPGKPKKEEEEETQVKKSSTPPKKAGEEEKKAPAKPATPKKEEEEEEARPKKPSLPGVGQVVSLAEEAKRAPHARIKEVFEKFADQIDTVTSVNGTVWEVEPLAKRFDPNDPKAITYKRRKDGVVITNPRDAVTSVTHYEVRLLEAARQLLNSGLDKPDASGKPLVVRSRLLKAVEMMLGEGLRFHVNAKAIKLRTDGWAGLEEDYKKELQFVQFSQIRAFTAEADWVAGEEWADHLRVVFKYPPTRDLMGVIESHYIAWAQALIAQDKHADARRKLKFYLDKYANAVSTDVEQVHRQLQERAAALVREGRELAAKKEASKAFTLLQKAEDIWPQVAGLAELREQTLKAFPVLRVGVKQLPTQVSPTTAVTDVDHAACRLVFDRLFELRSGPSARDGYECKLGIEIRQTLKGGFTLVLPQDIQWSDGKPFTSDDVKRSREVLVDNRSPYYEPLAAQLLKIDVEDDYNLVVEFTTGSLDPLSFLTFPLLPAHRLARERSPRDPAFGKSPIGTGPYIFTGIDGNEAIFVANPHYKRPHAPNGPAIKEIRFVQYSDFEQASSALSTGVVQILFGLTSKEFDLLHGMNQLDLLMPTQPREDAPGAFTNPRIHFLAPNIRKPELQSVELRKAISMSINRDAILDQFYRGKAKEHVVLNGPFPVASWAYDPQFSPVNPYKPQAAKGFVTAAQQKLGGTLRALSLKYPSDDPQAAKACATIGEMLQSNGITVKAESAARGELALELTKDRPNFDLIYWHCDFDNEALSLWPLFDPSGVNGDGRNYLGYRDDAALESLFRRVQARRDFQPVKTGMHALHEMITEQKALLIPLWQLDRPVAVHKTLHTTRIHPLWVFDDVELWKLKLGD